MGSVECEVFLGFHRYFEFFVTIVVFILLQHMLHFLYNLNVGMILKTFSLPTLLYGF
jgi:hypothetical protein